MKQHLPMPAERTIPTRAMRTPAAARPGGSTGGAMPAHKVTNAPTICVTRRQAHGTDGIWQNAPVALATAVFAPYHQRPKDSVT